MKLDPNLIEEYEKNGAICLRGVFSKEWIDTAAKGIEKNLASPSQFSENLKGDRGDGCYFDDYCNWKRIPEFRKFAFESPAADIVGQLMKSEYVAFYHEHVLVKDPGADKITPWHHDQSYYPIDGDKVCSIWMPVDPVPRDRCVEFVAGSHKWGWFYPVKFKTTLPYEFKKNSSMDRVFEPVPDIEGNKERYNILSWDLEPGDCIIFHMRTLHGAPGNCSSTVSRRILSTRWLGDDATLAERAWAISPPFTGGLKPGDRAVSDDFPILWRSGAA